jgi:hypothetical protein
VEPRRDDRSLEICAVMGLSPIFASSDLTHNEHDEMPLPASLSVKWCPLDAYDIICCGLKQGTSSTRRALIRPRACSISCRAISMYNRCPSAPGLAGASGARGRRSY